MLTLVTQPDGSARRFPFVTLLLVAALGFMLFDQWSAMQDAYQESEVLHEEALAYFHKNPFVEVDARFEAKVGTDAIEIARADFQETRKRLGMSPVPDPIKARSQLRFESMVEQSRRRYAQVPAQRFGISSTSATPPPENYFLHAFGHPTVWAFLLSVGLIFLLALPLEDVWGSFVLLGFLAIAIPGSGVLASEVTHGIWFGSCGIVGTLLGAALVRQALEGSPRLIGAIPIPSWFVAISWFASEAVVVHGVDPEALVVHDFLPHFTSMVIGLVLALGIRVAGLEEVLATRWDEGESVNPGYEKAMELRERGLIDKANQVLLAEYQKNPSNVDVATALWDISVQCGTPEQGREMGLRVVDEQLRAGAGAGAVKQWIEMTQQLPSAELLGASGELASRIADVLFTFDEEAHALEALRFAVASREPMNGALAAKAAHQLHERDPALAREAAAIAFADSGLRRGERSELVQLVGEVEPAVLPEPSPEPAAGSGDPFDSTFESVEATTAAEPPRAPLSVTPIEAAALDPDAAGSESQEAGSEIDDEDLDVDLESLDPNALSLDDLNEDVDVEIADVDRSAGVEGYGEVAFEALEAEATAEAPELDAAPPVASVADGSESAYGDSDPSSEPSDGEAPEALPGEEGELEAESTPDATDPSQVAAVVATPTELGSEVLKIRTETGRDLRLEWSKVKGIAVVAVADLAPKPVLVIDLVLNWDEGPPTDGSPLRVLRLRSDCFDPRPLTGIDHPVRALRSLVQLVSDVSGAVPLPDANSVAGQPFANFATLADYEREVLLGGGGPSTA